MNETNQQQQQQPEDGATAMAAQQPTFGPIAGRAVGAELIRQLSCHKLEQCFYQSDETLHQFGAAKRKVTAPIVKRYSDNERNRLHRPTLVSRAAAGASATAGGSGGAAPKSERPRLLRQSTTNSETVTGAVSAHSRRRQLVESKEHRSWRSCDVNHPDVAALAGTHRKAIRNVPGKTRSTSESIGRQRGDDMTPSLQRPSNLDLSCASSNSLSTGPPLSAQICTSASPSSKPPMFFHDNEVRQHPQQQQYHHHELPTSQQQQQQQSQQQQQRQGGAEQAPPTSRQLSQLQQQRQQTTQHDEPVRYTKATDDQSDDRVVLPPLAGNRVISGATPATTTNTNKKMLSQRMAKVAGSRTKKVLGKQQTGGRGRTAGTGPSAVAVATIAVAVVTGSGGGSGAHSKTSSSTDSSNPRRRARGIVILTSVFLLFTCLFLVGITLRLAPLIDDLGKMSSFVN